MARQDVHAQVALHGGEGARGALLGVELLHHAQALIAVLGGVFQGDFQQVFLVAALGDDKRQPREFHVGDDVDQDLGDTVVAVGLGEALPHLGQRHRHEFGIGLVVG